MTFAHNDMQWCSHTVTAGKIKVALSSGVTTENIDALVPYVDYFIVGTSIHDRDEKILVERVKALCGRIAAASDVTASSMQSSSAPLP